MSLGNASIKRATGAIGKTGEKSKKAAFTANRSLIELEISKIKFERSACDLAELKKSVKKYGILHPVFVLREGEEFILLSGKARMTAAAELGMESVPAVVLDMEGSGVSAAKKELLLKKAAPVQPSISDEIAASEDIHEEKFNAIKGIGSDLPDYLL